MPTPDQIYTLTVYYVGVIGWIFLISIFARRFIVAKRQHADRLLTLTLLVILVVVCAELIAAVYYGMYWSDLWWWGTGILSILNSPVLWGIPRTILAIAAWSMVYLALRYGQQSASPLYTAFRQVGLSLDVFQGLREGLEQMYQPKSTALMLYRAGKEAGKIFAGKVAEGGLSGRELFDRIVKSQISSGWADKYEILMFKLGKKVVTRSYGCFEHVGRKDTKPVCDFQRGFWTGVTQYLEPDMVCEGKETLCTAKGDQCCEFQVSFFEKAEPVKPETK